MSYAETVAAGRGAPPPFLDRRFDADGRALPDPGCTVIGHVARGPVHAALVAARDRLGSAPAGACFAWLPPASYHMTIFDGLLYSRRSPGFWPGALDAAATEGEAEAFVVERIAPLRPEGGTRFRMVPQALEPAPNGAGLWVRLAAAEAAEERRIRAFRDACAAALGLADRPGHRDYRFHITLAYAIGWPDEAAARAFDAALDEADARLRREAALFEIGPPELCRFADMTRFDPIEILR